MADRRAVEFGVVGLGQAGGNLAAKFAELGYSALVVNTSETDLASLSDLEEARRLHVTLPDGRPAARDRGEVARSIQAAGETLRKAVEGQLASSEAFLLCAGLGGVTGGAVAALVGLLADFGKPVAVLAVLPWKSESHLVKARALRALNEVLDTDFAALLLLDGQKLFDQYATVSVASFLTDADAQVAHLLDELNTLARSPDFKSIRTFDAASFHQLFFSGGVTLLGKAPLAGEISRDSLLGAMRESLAAGQLFAGPFRLADSLVVGAVVVAPQEALGTVSAAEFDAFWSSLKEETSGATIHSGIYAGGEESFLFVVAGGLPLPGRATELLEEATEEAARFSTKKEAKKRLRKLDLSALGTKATASAPEPPDTPSKGMAKAEEASPEPEETVVEEVVEEEEEVLDLEGEWEDDEG